MVNELFLDAAVRIRKTYLSVSKEVGSYRNRVEMTCERLNDTLSKIEKIQNDLSDKSKRKGMTNEGVLSEFLKILEDVEKEGEALHRMIEPLNKEIERLSVEEKELYRSIVAKHPNLTESQIVEQVRARLEKEKLL